MTEITLEQAVAYVLRFTSTKEIETEPLVRFEKGAILRYRLIFPTNELVRAHRQSRIAYLTDALECRFDMIVGNEWLGEAVEAAEPAPAKPRGPSAVERAQKRIDSLKTNG